jgi:hypothetical protein
MEDFEEFYELMISDDDLDLADEGTSDEELVGDYRYFGRYSTDSNLSSLNSDDSMLLINDTNFGGLVYWKVKKQYSKT